MVRNGGLPLSSRAELITDFDRIRALSACDIPFLAVSLVKVKTAGDRSFSSAGPSKAWNSPANFIRAGALACSTSLPALFLPCFAALLAIHFVGHSSEPSSAPTSFVLGKLADSVPLALRTSCMFYKESPV